MDFCNCWHLRRSRQVECRRLASVAVIGCGGVGDAAIAGARLAGAATIIAVDRDTRKLQWATDDVSAVDAVTTIQELTGGFGADVVFDAVGRPETWKQAFCARDLAGTVVLVGVPTPEQGRLPLDRFVSERIGLDDVEKAFHTMHAGEVLRSVVIF